MRKELDRRPAVLFAGALAIGLVLPLFPAALAVWLLGLIVVERMAMRGVLLVALLLGFALAPRPVQTLESREWVQTVLTVRTVPRLYPDRQVAQAGNYLLLAPPDPPLAVGDRIEVQGLARPFPPESERRYALQGLRGRLRPISLVVTDSGPGAWAEALRRRFLAYTSSTLSPETAAAVDALCLNVDTRLDDQEEEALRRTGTIHIVSASGLHVLFVAATLTFLLSLLPVSRGMQLAALAAALVIYATMTGLQGPMVRASFAGLAALVAYRFGRDPDLLSALGVAATAYLLAKPYEVYNAGFQLSFVIVGAFALFRKSSSGKPWADLARASVLAFLASTPLVAYHFGMVPLVAPLANALLVLVVPAVVLVATSGFLVSFLLPTVGQGLLLATTPWVQWLFLAVDTCDRLPFGCLSVPAFSGYWLLAIYGGLLCFWRERRVPA